MRSAKLMFLAFVLAGACASPLDEPIGQSESALRIVQDQELLSLPDCESVDRASLAAGEVLATVHQGLFAVAANGALICVDDSPGLAALDKGGPADGTPLPARKIPADGLDYSTMQGFLRPATTK